MSQKVMWCIGLILTLIASPVYAIVVTGEASTFELAKQQAFRNAVEHQVGVIVDSERTTIDNDVKQNQILSFSAGYVLDYTILSHDVTEPEGIHIVTVDVEVASSVLKNFILSRSDSSTSELRGSVLREQIQSYQQQLEEADRLLSNMLKYHPTQSQHIRLTGEHSVIVDSRRNVYLNLPYEYFWNIDYLKSLEELIQSLGERMPRHEHGHWRIGGALGFDTGVRPGILFNAETKIRRYRITDKTFMDAIKQSFDNREFVLITINSSHNQSVINTCVRVDSLYSNAGLNDIVLRSKRSTTGVLSVPIDAPELLDDNTTIEVSLQKGSNCPLV